jgi:hypothetical protein
MTGEIEAEGRLAASPAHAEEGDALMSSALTSNALAEKIDQLIEARLEDRLVQLPPARAPERGRHGGPGIWLALGSLGIAVPITGATAALLQGPEVIIALGIEWAAIAAINVAYAVGWPGARVAGTGAVRAQPEVPPVQPAPPLPPPDPLLRLPLAVLVKVEQIRRKAEVLLQHQGQFPIGSKDLYVLRRTQTEYLPSTLDAYLALSGDDRAVAPDGRTGLQVLRDQLDLLDSKLDEIADDLQRENVDRLLANERFLEEHFGHRAVR